MLGVLYNYYLSGLRLESSAWNELYLRQLTKYFAPIAVRDLGKYCPFIFILDSLSLLWCLSLIFHLGQSFSGHVVHTRHRNKLTVEACEIAVQEPGKSFSTLVKYFLESSAINLEIIFCLGKKG